MVCEVSDNRHQISLLLGLDNGCVEQPEAGDSDLGVPKESPWHVEQHCLVGCGSVVGEVRLRKIQQFLISDELDLP